MILFHQKISSDIVKYLIIGCIIFSLVVFIPYDKLCVKDAVILAIILTLTVAIIESVSTIMMSEQSTEKFDTTNPTTTTIQTTSTDTPQIEKTPVQQAIELSLKNAQQDKQTQQPVQQDKQTVSQLYKNVPNATDKEANSSRDKDGVVTTHLPYTDFHHLPLGDDYKPSDFEYGFSFLPPEKWYPTPPFPPVCVSEKRCPVCPAFTTGTPTDLKEWHSSSKILPPDGINTKFIEDTLNAGR